MVGCAQVGLSERQSAAYYVDFSDPRKLLQRVKGTEKRRPVRRDAILCAPPGRRLSMQEYAPPSAEATKRWLRTKWAETGYRPEATMAVAAPSPKVAA